MSHDITYDRVIGPSLVSSGSDQTTTTLTATSETAPTTVTALNYTNFVVVVACPGSTPESTVATCTDTQGSSYVLIKEVLFGGYALDVFSRVSTTPNTNTIITVAHQPSLHRIILSDEWYNIGTFEHSISAFSSTALAQVDSGSFKVGQKHWLVYAVLAIGGSPHGDAVTIPDDWNLLHDTGSNYGDGKDVRLVVCYQIAKKRKKITFEPVISNPCVWAAVQFAHKEKL